MGLGFGLLVAGCSTSADPSVLSVVCSWCARIVWGAAVATVGPRTEQGRWRGPGQLQDINADSRGGYAVKVTQCCACTVYEGS
jgi:hypothetical protein